MRRAVLLLGPIVASAILFACEDDGSSGSSGSFSPDGPNFEASPPQEGGPGPQPDAADAADAPDTSIPLPVSVNVLRGAGFAAGITVVFHDAAGAVIETKTTGANGKATSTVGMNPSQASVLLGDSSNHRIFTWTAVAPGDDLFVRDIGISSLAGSFSVTTQGDLSDAGAIGTEGSVGRCTGSGPSPFMIYLSTDCVRATSSVLARTYDDSNLVLGYAFKKGAAAPPTDGGASDVAVGQWLTPGTVTITPQNLPAAATQYAGLVDISDGLAFDNATGGGLGQGTASFLVAPGFAEAYQVSIRSFPNLTSGATQTVGKRVAPAANVAIDFATALPVIDSATVVKTTPRRPQIDWTTLSNASLASSDGGSIFVSWYDNRDESNGWTFIVPPNVKTVKAPAMPASADAWLPNATNDGGPDQSSFSYPSILFAESDLLPGYAAFRREIGRVIPTGDTNARDSRAVLPANGSLRMTAYQDSPQ